MCPDKRCAAAASAPDPISGRFSYTEFSTLRRGDRIVWIKSSGVLAERRVLSSPGLYSKRVGGVCIKIERIDRIAFEKPFNLYRYDDLKHRVAGVVRR